MKHERFFLGSLDPFWPHAILLTFAIAASFAVAAGIVLENPKWSLANVLVVGGVAIEALCTLLLFGFDEGISGAQERTIVAQNRRIEQLLTPRKLDAAQRDRIAAVAKKFPSVRFVTMNESTSESWHFALDISGTLKNAGWDWREFPGIFVLKPIDGRPAEGVSVLDHIEIQATPTLVEAAGALAEALRDPSAIGMEKTSAVPISNADWIDPKAELVIVIIGSKT